MRGVVRESRWEVSFGDSPITDLKFTDDSVTSTETRDALIEALEKLGEEAEPLGLRVSWIETKIYSIQRHLGSCHRATSYSGWE